MSVIERYRAEFDRMPHYGAEGCVCGNAATPDRECPLHAANWVIERLEDQLRGAAVEWPNDVLDRVQRELAGAETPLYLAADDILRVLEAAEAVPPANTLGGR
jgi:hypothetical protein